MRIDRINLGVDTDEKGMVRSASVYFENVNELGERISGNFGITVEQYKKIQTEELTIREIAEAKITELFELKPSEDAMAGVVELRKQIETNKSELTENVNTIKAELTASYEQVEKSVKQAIGEELETLKQVTRKLIKLDDLTAEEVADLVEIYPKYEADKEVAKDYVFSYEGKLYRVVQSHTTNSAWIPGEVAALYVEIAPPSTENGTEIIPNWVQPTGAHDAYKLGDKMKFTDGKIYKSKIEGNVHAPDVYPDGWELVMEDDN